MRREYVAVRRPTRRAGHDAAFVDACTRGLVAVVEYLLFVGVSREARTRGYLEAEDAAVLAAIASWEDRAQCPRNTFSST